MSKIRLGTTNINFKKSIDLNRVFSPVSTFVPLANSTVNLIVNGGAETTDTSKWYIGGRELIPHSGSYSFSSSTEVNYSDPENPIQLPDTLSYTDANVLTPGNTYSLSFWTRGLTGDASGTLSSTLGNLHFNGSSIWTYHKIENVLATSTYFNLTFNTDANVGYKVLLDDVWLQRNVVAH